MDVRASVARLNHVNSTLTGRTRPPALHTRIFITRHGMLRPLVFAWEADMPNKSDVSGRTAVVTGGAQGIGRVIVERFLESGAAVAIWDRDAGLAKKAAAELQ